MGYRKDEMETASSKLPEIRSRHDTHCFEDDDFTEKLIYSLHLPEERNPLSYKTGNIHSILAADNNRGEEKVVKKGIFVLLFRAFVTSFLVFFTMVYIHQGSLIFNENGSTIFNRVSAFELSATFVFLFLVFVAHRGISNLMNDPRLAGFHSVVKGILEAFLVVVSSTFLLFIVIVVPFSIVFPDIEVQPGRVRFNFVVIAIITLFFYYFVERERSKKQLQAQMLRAAQLQKENFEAQLKSLKDQVSPHFLFNSLNVLSSLIQQDTEKAAVFTQRLSDLYRSLLSNSDHQLIPLQKELEVAEAYIYLLKTRFGEAVQFQLDIAPEKKELLLPPGSLQMLLENSIKHNGSTRKKPLLIRIFSEGDSLIVINNLQPRQEKVDSTGTGLQNIKRRYRYLSDEEVKVTTDQKEFRVRLPLLKMG